MSDDRFDNPTMRDGVDIYTGNSRGRRGGSPVLIAPCLTRQLIDGFFWAKFTAALDIEIAEGFLNYSLCDVTSNPPAITCTQQVVPATMKTVVNPGDIISLKATYSAGLTPVNFDFPDGAMATVHVQSAIYQFSGYTYVVTAGYPTPSGTDKFFPIALYNGPNDLTQLHVGVVEVPFMFATSFHY